MPTSEAKKAANKRYEAKMKVLAELCPEVAEHQREMWRQKRKRYYEKHGDKIREKAREYSKVYKQRIKELAELGRKALAELSISGPPQAMESHGEEKQQPITNVKR